MPSRAEAASAPGVVVVSSATGVVRVAGAVLHVVALASMALALWRLMTPAVVRNAQAVVRADGGLETSFATLLRAPAETIAVSLDGVPDVQTRAAIRTLRASGHSVLLTTDRTLPGIAVAAEEEWRASGGARVQMVAPDSQLLAVRDGAGLIDSMRVPLAGDRRRTGPITGLITLATARAQARVAPLRAANPATARVFVAGDATWESRFLVAALEEAGWPVDVAITLSPRVVVAQGEARRPTRTRHAIVIALPGASPAVLSSLPAFARSGGGVVLVGEVARSASLASLRAGTPGAARSGEVGAEASDHPRDGLDVVPLASLARDAVALEMRDGMTTVAARRVGAGRVLQVGYDNSWLWRMAGNDDAPVAHRRWWTALLSGLVPLSAPVAHAPAMTDSLGADAAPVAAMARDVGLPAVQSARLASDSASFVASLDLRLLLILSLISLVASWAARRWRGLA